MELTNVLGRDEFKASILRISDRNTQFCLFKNIRGNHFVLIFLGLFLSIDYSYIGSYCLSFDFLLSYLLF